MKNAVKPDNRDPKDRMIDLYTGQMCAIARRMCENALDDGEIEFTMGGELLNFGEDDPQRAFIIHIGPEVAYYFHMKYGIDVVMDYERDCLIFDLHNMYKDEDLSDE
jgi:hypothetical protein